jgi:hypothetical protein
MAEEKQYSLPYFIHKVFTLAQNDLFYHRQYSIEDSVITIHKILKHNCPINLSGTVIPMTEVM